MTLAATMAVTMTSLASGSLRVSLRLRRDADLASHAAAVGGRSGREPACVVVMGLVRHGPVAAVR